MALLNIIAVFSIVSAVSSTCTNGKCDVDDATSFIQYKQTVTAGEERQFPEGEAAELEELDAESEESKEVVFEEFTAEETEGDGDGDSLPDGCVDMGCLGDGPSCGGNELQCTAHGFVVRGYYKSCGDGKPSCQSGYKVRCSSCPGDLAAKAKPAPYPKPAPGPALWTAPAPAPTEAPAKPPPPAETPVLPTNAPVYPPAPFDKYALGNATLALKNAKATAAELTKNLSAAEAVVAAVKKNISTFKDKEEEAHKSFESNRETAVSYSKKKELANITVFKAQAAMNTAYFAQKGAEKGAQDWGAKAKNYIAEKLYYEKKLVDMHHATTSAQHLVDLAEATVKKATSDLAGAKTAQSHHEDHEEEENKYRQNLVEDGLEAAEKLAVKIAQEHSYIESTGGDRNESNIPPYGGQ